jgi:hypothetical protein
MCVRAIKLQPYIDEWLAAEIRLKHPTRSQLSRQTPQLSTSVEVDWKDLKKLELGPSEWEHLRHITKLLERFKGATNQLSRNRTPQIQTIWLMYDGLFNTLEDMSTTLTHDHYDGQDLEWHAVVQRAAKAGRDKLTKYYARTGGPQGFLFNVATILNPNTKLTLYDVSYHGFLSQHIADLSRTHRGNQKTNGRIATSSWSI